MDYAQLIVMEGVSKQINFHQVYWFYSWFLYLTSFYQAVTGLQRQKQFHTTILLTFLLKFSIKPTAWSNIAK